MLDTALLLDVVLAGAWNPQSFMVPASDLAQVLSVTFPYHTAFAVSQCLEIL